MRQYSKSQNNPVLLQKMEVLIILLLVASIQKVTPVNFAEDPVSVHSCEVGDIIQNERITCTCTQNYVYDCFLKKPLKNQPHKPFHKNWTCHPNKIYVEETTTCICNYNGTWPHSACGEVFDSLPARDVVKAKCQPNGYVFIGCNVCRCDSEGLIDKSRCTNNECHESVTNPERRRSSKTSDVFGNCEAKNWYSLAPCQFCFCLNENKLVCNTGNFNTKLQLGTYNLNVCGKDLIKTAIELIPGEENQMRQGMKNIFTSTTLRPEVVNKKNNLEEVDVIKEEYKERVRNDHTERIIKKYRESSESVQDKGDYDVQDLDRNRNRKVDTTQIIPFQEDYQHYSKESMERGGSASAIKDVEEDENTDNEIEDPGLKIPINPPEKKITLKDLGNQLQASWPMVLDKVFRMALRRSKVTIGKDNNCVPGSVSTVKCNTCFCLKNSKLLCTNNTCD